MHWKRVQQAIENLGYDFQQFDLESLVRRIEDQRQRGITRIPFPFQPGLTGLWIPATNVDYIFYDQNTHSLHQTHIILHELAHIVLGHRCQPLTRFSRLNFWLNYKVFPHRGGCDRFKPQAATTNRNRNRSCLFS